MNQRKGINFHNGMRYIFPHKIWVYIPLLHGGERCFVLIPYLKFYTEISLIYGHPGPSRQFLQYIIVSRGLGDGFWRANLVMLYFAHGICKAISICDEVGRWWAPTAVNHILTLVLEAWATSYVPCLEAWATSYVPCLDCFA